MECCVHSPCGRYLVRYAAGADSMRIDVVPKVSAFEPAPEVHYAALLREGDVLEITTAAGVRKEFAGFADMTYNAMIGRSPSVKFFVETCEEMRSRITAEVAQRGRGAADSLVDDSDASQLSDAARAQRFFTLDYDVDFTRAVFPVPLLQVTPAAVCGAASASASVDPQPRGTAPRQDGATAGAEAAGNAQLARLRTENEKLRRENAALARLSREKMLEMQRLCEDFQQRVDGACEVERLKKKLSALRTRLRQAEEERDAAHAAFARLKQRAPHCGPQPDSSRRGEKVRRRSRFDTPSPVPRRSSSRRLGDSPAPRGRTGGRQGRAAAAARSRSLSHNDGGGTALTKKRLWTDAGSSSRCSSSSLAGAAGSRCSSRGSCERLYRTPTASSRMHQRDSPVYVPRRAVFR
ncbi:uncharacterized protein Tco025E_03893 [Trypanosoma conorhini]|uniref:Uncharacterized protein n=1 Tax=Trypanosoma conorhini TaxID=83891 RepID=A0A3R7L3A2_9TRYP|nr:uncharacterized protein Tco025E_03893 [Trypanosoma conorhini]RNF20192.1 hypothetical protein Tco025E_03893 [Trypanosoma conorhini]